MKKNSFLYGTFILIIVNFIVRFFGFAYKILLSRMIGAEGIGLFHLVFPVLMVLITFTTAGIPIAVSKLVAQNLSLNNKRGCNQVLFYASILGIFISLILSFLLYYYAKYISTSIIKNEDTYFSLIALTPAIPLITLSSIFRGYYYGIKNVGPAGLSQVLEQIFRILFVLGSLYVLGPFDTKQASMIAVLGISVGELVGLLFLVFKLKTKGSSHLQRMPPLFKNETSFLSKIIFISIPLTTTRLIAVIMQSINSILIPQRLLLAGYTSQKAISTFGKISGMAMPLLFLPFIITSALVVNLIPSISEEMALKNWKHINLKSNLAIRITLLVAIPTTSIFIFFSKSLCSFMYAEPDVGIFLTWMAFATPFLCLHHIASGILHGMGKQILTTIHYLIGMTIQLWCTYYLIPNPIFAEKGFILGFVLSLSMICILDVRSLSHYVKLNINIRDTLIKPILATIAMTFIILKVYHLCLGINLRSYLCILSSMTAGFVSYILIILLSGSISFKALKYIFRKKP